MLSPIVHLSYAFVVLTSIYSYAKADCASYGIDFQNGASYFINNLDNSNFTTVTQFVGCTGIADVIIVGPDENSWLCSDVPTQPDNVNELSTCPLLKNEMYSGSWTIVILGNNGNSSSFAAQRTFDLLVGPQLTVTYTPTVNITSVVTPSTTLPTTITQTDSTTIPAVTITEPSATADNTVTITPSSVTTTVTSTSTQTVISRKFTFPIVTVTKTASCRVPTKLATKDPYPNQHYLALARSVTSNSYVKRTAMPAPAAALITPAPRANINNRDDSVEIANVLGRRAVGRLLEKKLNKRAPDVPTLTITDTTTSDWKTSTIITTTNTTTFYTTATTTTFATITPAPVTVLTGVTTSTITAPTPTRTETTQTRTVTTVTSIITHSITITQTTTPASVIETCTAKGGVIV
ncbi:hypothetical protein DSL72_001579 [Monilinia vaccinii-corymbosi]|uniref:P-selectin glycoprotein ligand 1 n=1 Tax=Monilinia vaccinii-corymbosi TaxID=61207 RepID=A0A8A3P545_9HELO|nr:hypothetical protein DSL72_001579 [Monilinia vaccinii-corymbosi]